MDVPSGSLLIQMGVNNTGEAGINESVHKAKNSGLKAGSVANDSAPSRITGFPVAEGEHHHLARSKEPRRLHADTLLQFLYRRGKRW